MSKKGLDWQLEVHCCSQTNDLPLYETVWSHKREQGKDKVRDKADIRKIERDANP